MLEDNAQSIGNPEWGYAVDFSPKPDDVIHQFCGVNNIPGAICPYCKKPLLRVLSLNAKDARLGIAPEKTAYVHLLYCWTCSIPYGEFSYKIKSDGGVEIVNLPPVYQGALGPDGPYDDYTGTFAAKDVALRPLTESTQRDLVAWLQSDSEDPNGLDDYLTHQIGGVPFIYNPSKAFCPSCKAGMPLLAAICDSAVDNNPYQKNAQNSFAGNGGVQMIFSFCRNCSVVSACHSVD